MPTKADWFHLNASVSPEGALSGAIWTPPAGSIAPWSYGAQGTSVFLEVAKGIEGASQEWGILGFRVRDGHAKLLTADFNVPFNVRSRAPSGLMPPAPISVKPTGAPFFMDFGHSLLREGDAVGLVVLARGAAGGFPLAFRVVDHDPGHMVAASVGVDAPDAPSRDYDEFLQRVHNGTRVDLPVTSGSGFHVAAYAETDDLAVQGWQAWTEPVERTEGLPVDVSPAADLRDLTLESQGLDGAGWSYALGMAYEFRGGGVAAWELAGNLHGQTLAAARQITDPPPTLFPFFVAEGEGPSGSGLRMHTLTAKPTYVQEIAFVHLDLGARLSALLGVPAVGSTSVTPIPAELRSQDEVPSAVGAGAGKTLIARWDGATITLLGGGCSNAFGALC